MYHVSAQGVNERMINVHYYYLPRWCVGHARQVCIGLDELLTIERILLTCSDLIEIRESHFTAQSLRVLFQDISPVTIFTFLKEIII